MIQFLIDALFFFFWHENLRYSPYSAEYAYPTVCTLTFSACPPYIIYILFQNAITIGPT